MSRRWVLILAVAGGLTAAPVKQRGREVRPLEFLKNLVTWSLKP